MHSATWILPIFILVSAIVDSESSDGSPLEMIFSDRENLIKLDLKDPGKYEQIVDGQSNAVAVDYDIGRGLLVWSDVRKKGLYSANIETGEERKIIATRDIVTPDGLAVDWIYGNLYWTDTGTNTISVASLDGEMRKLLFHEEVDEPRAIVVDPFEGWMFWTDWGSHPKIEKSGMDGTHRTKVIARDIGIPNGLAIDFNSKKLFWADVRFHNLRSSDYDGSNVQTILQSFTHLGHPFAVDVFQDCLYWTDWRSHSITKVTVTDKIVEKVTTRSYFFPMGLRVYNSQKQPKGRNYCVESAECSHLCLSAPKITENSQRFTCACPDGMTLTDDQKNCTTAKNTTATETTTTLISTTTECPYIGAFFCGNGRCIRSSWVCDGDNDCNDRSDEANCSTSTTTRSTTSTIALYTTTTPGCPYNPAFICANSRCIKRSWVCDGDNDCRDNSDEEHCQSARPTTYSTTRSTTYLTTDFTSPPPTTEAPSQSKLESYEIDKLLHEIHESVAYYGRFSGIIFGTFIFLIVLISLMGFYVYKQNLRGRSSGLNFVNPVFKKKADDTVKLELSRNSDAGVDPLI